MKEGKRGGGMGKGRYEEDNNPVVSIEGEERLVMRKCHPLRPLAIPPYSPPLSPLSTLFSTLTSLNVH